MASDVCASSEMEPYDMAPVQKRRTMLAAGSTSSSGMAVWSPLNLRRPRRCTRRESAVLAAENSLYSSRLFSFVACCSLAMAMGSFMCTCSRNGPHVSSCAIRCPGACCTQHPQAS